MSANQPTPAVVAPAPPQAPPPVAVPAPMQPAAAAPQPAAAAPQRPAAAPQQQPVASKPAEAPVAPVDAVIDDVFGRQLGMQERQLAADEMAYSFFSSVRDSCGDEMDPETSAELNRLLALSQAEKDAILQKTNRVARRVLRPLGYKVLEVQGLNPATVSPAAARAALQAELTPQQQAAVDAETERLFKEVYIPELQAAAEEAEGEDPETAWRQFGETVMARQPPEPQQQNTAAVAVPAALAGAVVALVVSKVVGWLQRRRQRRQDSDMLTDCELYEDEGELLTGSDSGQDAATAYDG